ncbi:DUF3572 domain-containing protein [Sulfitobacter sp. F26169L]|uniref:DUF3572 domain-containing protein n=1 Tax=Sulfitobacter sp. F26169L TaxID=2996015 RepID=UPI002260BE1E|nr:DUF3572 domain-containing protein [Sulfitobacter sp. F26169L]MCX7566465.1 DUF3572 domain-containing protein [Sulfitobacter sp. F26169L]
MSLTRITADTIALHSLGWLVANEDLLPVFLGATGASETDMRSAAQDPEFLGSVLDFIMMDDAWVIACCDAQDIPYERLAEARQSLPGGGQVHWT